MKHLLTLMCCLVVFGCSSAIVRVETTPPQANVRVIDPTTGEASRIGESPIEVIRNGTEALEADLILVEVTKEGYFPERFWVPNTLRFRRLARADLKIVMKEKPKSDSIAIVKDTWNRAINLMLDAQRLTVQRKFELAEAKLYESIELVGEYPEAKRLFGTIYFLKGEYAKSKRIWTEILDSNSQDKEAFRMFRLIESKQSKSGDGEQ